MRDDDWFKPHPDRPAALPRQPKPGEEVWRLRDSDTGRVQTCELRDNSRAGAGWEVQILDPARSWCPVDARTSAKLGTWPRPRARIRSEQVRPRSRVTGASSPW
jgi:hypothetical protein